MMIRVSHSDVRVLHGMHVNTASSDVQEIPERMKLHSIP
jgi:hypothetical protein